MAETPSSAAVLSDAMAEPEDPQLAAVQRGVFKARSFETTYYNHEPAMETLAQAPMVILLGDSMIERMITTGNSPSLTPWPSDQMLRPSQLSNINAARAPSNELQRIGAVFNAGCGGDKVENMLYRLTRITGPAGDQAGLLHVLAKHQTQVKLWVVHAGTNNLHEKRGLTDASISAMRVLLKVLMQASAPRTHILVTALFYRTDISHLLIDQANANLKQLVEEVSAGTRTMPTTASTLDEGNAVISIPKNTQRSMLEASALHCNSQSVRGSPINDHEKKIRFPFEPEFQHIQFLPMPRSFDAESHLDDHVHLNRNGYLMWMETLFPQVADMLKHADDVHRGVEGANAGTTAL